MLYLNADRQHKSKQPVIITMAANVCNQKYSWKITGWLILVIFTSTLTIYAVVFGILTTLILVSRILKWLYPLVFFLGYIISQDRKHVPDVSKVIYQLILKKERERESIWVLLTSSRDCFHPRAWSGL